MPPGDLDRPPLSVGPHLESEGLPVASWTSAAG